MFNRKRLKLKFNSDWHIGSGTGIPGNVDSQVLRDEDGFPYVPGKTLTGILRDAAEWIAEARGGSWDKVLYSLFGNQPVTHGGLENSEASGAKLGIGSAELDNNFRECLKEFNRKNIDLISQLFSVHPGVKIDPNTGCSLKDHLFSIEKARTGCTLYAPVTLFQELDDKELKLLNDAVKAVRRIGGKRRRGAGDCRLELQDIEDESSNNYKSDKTKLNFSRDTEGYIKLDVRLKTLQSVIITRTAIGNEVRSDTEIPGAMMLAYYSQNILAPLLGQERAKQAVMKSEITVSGFLPEFDGKASMPVPLCLGELKEEKIPVNRLITPPSVHGKKQIKDLRTGYVTLNNKQENGIEYYSGASIKRVMHTHNTVDDSVQRPTERTGGLFTYEAVGAGQIFRGTVRFSPELWTEIENSRDRDLIFSRLAHDVHTFGRSRKDEYGTAELECLALDDEQQNLPLELIDGRNGKATGKYLVAYLLSDLLLRNKYQGYTVKLEDVKNALSEKLQVELEDIPDDEWLEADDAFISPLVGTRGHCVRSVRRESWLRGWTLPRTSLVFIKAGSIFMFKVKNPEAWDTERARAVMNNGLGERRAEGYGRIMLNPQFLCSSQSNISKHDNNNNNKHENDKSKINIKLPKDSADNKFILDLASDYAKRSFRQLARREAYDIVNKGSGIFKASWDERPSASQFGALREAAALLGTPLGKDIFINWVEAVTRKDRKENPWNKSWQNMLSDMACKVDTIIWEQKSFKSFKDNFPAELQPVLANLSEYMLGVFLDLLCEAVFDNEKRKEQELTE